MLIHNRVSVGGHPVALQSPDLKLPRIGRGQRGQQNHNHG